MLKGKDNSLHCGKYWFRPRRYDKNGNLICELCRNSSHGYKSFITGRYNFDKEKFIIDYKREDVKNKHLKLLGYILKQYDWELE